MREVACYASTAGYPRAVEPIEMSQSFALALRRLADGRVVP